ncbi:MAG TPA: hypothetical protein PLP17_09140, partial [Oligoflexia bacterium]|nr:hypothetical protein [Oligoflexia bacterium]
VDFSTKPEEAARAIDESLRVIEKSRLELFDVRTLEQSKAAITRSFLFKFAEPEAVVERAAMLQILGYEADYDARFLANIAAVTGVDVLAAAKSRIHPDNFVVVVVGDVAGEQLNEGLRAKLPVFHFMFDDQPVLLE